MSLFICVAFAAFIPNVDLAQSGFSDLLIDNDLTFEMPVDFIEVPVRENPDLFYNYAIKHRKADFEIRYSIFPLAEMLQEYEASLSDSSRIMIDPNQLYKSLFIVNILNVSQIRMGEAPIPEIIEFQSKAVNDEFGCEYGATTFFAANSEFSGEYKYCSMVYLHKENTADVCISFLVKKMKTFEKYFHQAFYALRFIRQ